MVGRIKRLIDHLGLIKAKITIPSIQPIYPIIPSPTTGRTNWPINKIHISKLNWRQIFPCQYIHHVYHISINISVYQTTCIQVWPEKMKHSTTIILIIMKRIIIIIILSTLKVIKQGWQHPYLAYGQSELYSRCSVVIIKEREIML